MMMRRIIVVILCAILILSTVGCSNNNTNETKTDIDIKDDEQKEITILIKSYDYDYLDTGYKILWSYAKRFETEKGIKVNFDIINGNNPDDYAKKMNTKLYLEDGPTLIFISLWDLYKNYSQQGVAVNTKSKIPNLEKVYDSLLDDEHYFVPIGMRYSTIVLNRSVLDKLRVEELNADWTGDDYLEIKEKCLNQYPEYFTSTQYWELTSNFMDDLEILDESNKKVNLNNPKVIRWIKDIRDEIFSGKYFINEDYTYENYYRMFFEYESEEHKESIYFVKYYNNQDLRRKYDDSNGLKSIGINTYYEKNDCIILPNSNVVHGDLAFCTWGFLVNKNGKNVDLGMEFLNDLLSDEIQLEMFNQKFGSYPVNKEIEKKIENIEKEKNINEKAVALRKYILEQIEKGIYKPYNQKCNVCKEKIISMLYKDFVKFIFADEAYTDEEISKKLQKLEDKCNMWLNE